MFGFPSVPRAAAEQQDGIWDGMSDTCRLCVWGQLRTWQRCRGPCQPWGAWLSPRTKAHIKGTPTGFSSEWDVTTSVRRGGNDTKLEFPLLCLQKSSGEQAGVQRRAAEGRQERDRSADGLQQRGQPGGHELRKTPTDHVESLPPTPTT